MLEAALVAGLAAEGVRRRALGVAPTPAVAWLSAADGVAGGGDLGVAQPVRRQRHQAVRARRREAHRRRRRTRSRPSSTRSLRTPAGTAAAGGGHRLVDDDAAGVRPLGASPWSPRIEGAASTGCRWWSTAPTARPRRSRPRCCGRSAPTVEVLHAEPDGRNINDGCGSTHPEAAAGRGRRSGAPTSASPSTATPTGCSPSTPPAGSSTATRSSPSRAIDRHERGRAGRRHRRGHGDDQPRVPARHGRRTASRWSRRRSATATCSRPSARRASALGGEQSGHVIFRDLATTGDGLLTAVQLLDVVRRTRAGRWPSWPTRPMTRLPQVLRNVRGRRRRRRRRRPSVGRRRRRGRGRARRRRPGARPAQRHRAAGAGDGRGRPPRRARPTRSADRPSPPSTALRRPTCASGPAAGSIGTLVWSPAGRSRAPCAASSPSSAAQAPVACCPTPDDRSTGSTRDPAGAPSTVTADRIAAARSRRPPTRCRQLDALLARPPTACALLVARPATPAIRGRAVVRRRSPTGSASDRGPPRRTGADVAPTDARGASTPRCSRSRTPLWAVARDRLPHAPQAVADLVGAGRVVVGHRGRHRRSSRRCRPSTASRSAGRDSAGLHSSCATTASTSTDPAIARARRRRGRPTRCSASLGRARPPEGAPQLRLQGGRRDR